MTNDREPTSQSDLNAVWAAIADLRGAVGRIEGAVNALVEGQRELIENYRLLAEGQRQINQRIDKVIFVSIAAGSTLTAAMIGGLVAVAILG